MHFRGVLPIALMFCCLFLSEGALSIGALTKQSTTTKQSALAKQSFTTKQAPNRDPQIELGKYLTIAGNCASCHSPVGGSPESSLPEGGANALAGGMAFETPFGTIHATNISSSVEHGIGAWSDREFLNAMRRGVRPDGEHLYPVFPFTAYTKLTDADIAAIFAYLKSLPSIAKATPENKLSFPFNQRWLMALWKPLFLTVGPFQPERDQSEAWNRGAYLVEALGHCGACHSPRNFLGGQREQHRLSGGEYLDRVPTGVHRVWSAPNLTSSERGLGLWSSDEITDYLSAGRNSFLESYGPMNEVIMNSTRHLDTKDLDAIALYLKSIPAVDDARDQPPDPRTLGRGRTVYNLHCGTCHLPTGEGDPEMGPRLNAGSLVVQAANPASMINTVLYGPELSAHRVPGSGPRWREPMEDFQYLLDDEEIAAVLTFVRNSWDNSAGAVTAEQVAGQR